MKKTILFSATSTEKRAALLENESLVELVLERPDSCRIAGNIYRGKVISLIPGIQSAFIDIGAGKAAFLHASDVDPSLLIERDDEVIEQYTQTTRTKSRKIHRLPIEKLLEVGQEILVQVLKEPIGTKGAKVTTRISLAGRFLVLIPDADFIGVSKKNSDSRARARLKRLIAQLKPPGIGFIVRTIGLQVSESEFVSEIRFLLDKWQKTQEAALAGNGPKLLCHELSITTRVIRDMFSVDVQEVYTDEDEDYREIVNYLRAVSPDLVRRVKRYRDRQPLFDRFAIEKEIETSLRRKVWLKNGGYILFDHTEALVAIDVNTGRNVGRKSMEETIFETNLEASKEIGRQLRLRDIGGLIVVDFIDMKRMENRRKIEAEMRRQLQIGVSPTLCTGLSKFCLMEITRKRIRPELQELYTDACPTCNGLGWIFSPAAVAARIDRRLNRADMQRRPRKLALSVHPTVAAYLQKENPDILKKLEKAHSCSLTVIENGQIDQDEYEFSPINEDKPSVIKL